MYLEVVLYHTKIGIIPRAVSGDEGRAEARAEVSGTRWLMGGLPGQGVNAAPLPKGARGFSDQVLFFSVINWMELYEDLFFLIYNFMGKVDFKIKRLLCLTVLLVFKLAQIQF